MFRRCLAVIKNCAPLRRAFSLESPTHNALQTQHNAGKWIVNERTTPTRSDEAATDALATLASTETRRRRRSSTND